ncbi:MAG TPA: NAD(P)-dependent alcohol dehydrogenase [Armatimonadetes bacterium]|nr:NAD(P)-dependent alcohol dehydrogenase [Armatimonadota bacterium]
MQVARLYGIRDVRVEEMPEPGEPGRGEVLLRLTVVGVCGSDVHYYTQGRIGDQVVTRPLILGHEPAGVVEALGPGVTHLRAGDRVAVDPAVSCGACESCREGHPNLCPQVRFFGTPPVDGAFRELVVHPASCVFPLPPEVSEEEGALLETFGVGLHAVDLGHLRPGFTVAVLGCGPVGLMTLLAARLGGAAQVFATDLLSWRLEAARELGATAAFNPQERDVVREILAATQGRGVDVAFEAAGAAETPQQCTEVAKRGGTVVLIGIPDDDTLHLTHSTARRKGLTLKMCRRMKHVYPRAIRLVAKGCAPLAPLVTHRFPLSRVAEAFDLVANYRDGVIKAVVEM